MHKVTANDDHFGRINKLLASYLNDQETADLIFITNDHERVHAHRSILARNSKMLANLFMMDECCSCQGAKCPNKKEPMVIQLECSGKAIKDVLKILYTGQVSFKEKIEGREMMYLCRFLDIKLNFAIIEFANNGNQVANAAPPEPQVANNPLPAGHVANPPAPQQVAQHQPIAQVANSRSNGEAAQVNHALNSSQGPSKTSGTVKRSKLRGPKSVRAKREPSSSSDEYEPEDEPRPSSSANQPLTPIIRPPSSNAIPIANQSQAPIVSIPSSSFNTVTKAQPIAPRPPPVTITRQAVLQSQVKMAKQFGEDKAKPLMCLLEGCNEMVAYANLSKHFKDHLMSLNKPMKVIKSSSADGEGEATLHAPATPYVAPAPVTHMVARPGSSIGGSHSASGVNGINQLLAHQPSSLSHQPSTSNSYSRPAAAAASHQASSTAAGSYAAASVGKKSSSPSAEDESSTGNSEGGSNVTSSDVKKRPIIMRVTGGTASFTSLNQKEDNTVNYKQNPAENLSDSSSDDDNDDGKSGFDDQDNDSDGDSPSKENAFSGPRSARPTGKKPRTTSESSARSARSTTPRESPRKTEGRKPTPLQKSSAQTDQGKSDGDKENVTPKTSQTKKRPRSESEEPEGPQVKKNTDNKTLTRTYAHTPSLHKAQDGRKRPFGCQICSKGFVTFRELRTHYTLDHFWDKLQVHCKNKDKICQICMKIFETNDHLIQHMGNFHSYIDIFLKEKNLLIMNEDRTVRTPLRVCQICSAVQKSSTCLKAHMSRLHYAEELKKEFELERGIDRTYVRNCPKCDKLFDKTSSGILSHMGSFHDEVLKYCANQLKLDDEDMEYVPVDDFDDGTEGKPYQDPAVLEAKGDIFDCAKCGLKFDRNELKIHYLEQHYQEEFRRDYNSHDHCVACDKQVKDQRALHRHIVDEHEQFLVTILEKDFISLPPTKHATPKKKAQRLSSSCEGHEVTFQLLFCQICNLETASAKDLKKHYVGHLRGDFPSGMVSAACNFCSMKFTTMDENLEHMAINHTEQALIPYMQDRGLWINEESIVYAQKEFPVKAVDVKLKNVNRIIKSKKVQNEGLASTIEEIAKMNDYDNDDESSTELKCKMTDCSYEGDSETSLKMHLSSKHFRQELELKYKSEYNNDKWNCFICKKKLSEFGVLTSYLTHVGTEHLSLSELSNLQNRPENDENPNPQETATSKSSQLIVGSSWTNDRSQKEPTPEATKIKSSQSGGGSKPRQVATKSGSGGRISVRTPVSINKDFE